MLLIHCLITFFQVLVTYPTQELICYSAIFHYWVKKWDTKVVRQSGIPVPPQYQGMGEFSQNPEQGVVGKSSNVPQKLTNRPYNVLFLVLEWFPHLIFRRNPEFHDIEGHTRDIKVSGTVNSNESDTFISLH